MTTNQVDRLIASQDLTVFVDVYGDTFHGRVWRRDRYCFFVKDRSGLNGKFDRSDIAEFHPV